MMPQNSTILTEFEQHLKRRSAIRPNQQPYYIKWVKMYLSAVPSLKNLGETVTVKHFVNDLSSQDRFTDWQVNQAMDAIQLFQQDFMPYGYPEMRLASFGMHNLAEVRGEIAEVVSLRHYSPSTCHRSRKTWF